MKKLNEAIKHTETNLFAGYTITIEQKLSNAIQFTAERTQHSKMYWLSKDYYLQVWNIETCEYENAKIIYTFQ